MTAIAEGVMHPCPLFEGSEKRLEAEFSLGGASPSSGLRALTRAQLDDVLQQAACCIVSCRSCDDYDAYVLSESSLFVFADRLMLKTCGTTELLAAVPTVVDLAAGLGMRPCRIKYSRASFLFPDKQPAPHHSFSEEVAFLQRHVGHLGAEGAYVLGNALQGLQWHVYVAGGSTPGEAVAQWPGQQPRCVRAADHCIEVCMTDLDPAKAAQFCRGDAFVSPRHTSLTSGIAALLPGADVDEFVFEPCGYSMNGLHGRGAFSTVHITPEEACSYASVELAGCPEADPAAFVAQAAQIFMPKKMTVCVSADPGAPLAAHLAPPAGYRHLSASVQRLPCGALVIVHSLQAADIAPPALAPKEAAVKLLAQPQPQRMEEDLEDDMRSVLTGMDESALPAPDHQVIAAMLARGGSPCSSTDGLACMAAAAGDSAFSETASEAGKGTISRPSSPEADWAGWQLQKQLVGHPAIAALGERASGVAAVLARHRAQLLPRADAGAVDALLARLIRQHSLEDPVCVVDLGAVLRLFRTWAGAMPRVTPYYAVKCNNNPALLSMLAALGAGFDCASDCEVDMVARLGVPPERIVFANACKRPRDIRTAAAKQVDLTTFDTACELAKLARWHPQAKALLRIRADDPAARCQLGNKYGAEPDLAPGLLRAAKQLGIQVVGVSFHVGSGATNPDAFSEAISLARGAFDAGAALGFDMRILDIGGGFCAALDPVTGTFNMGGVPAAVNAALDAHFPVCSGVRVIAEPGRYFAEAPSTLACMVYGVRDGVPSAPGGPVTRDYWITDGLYGSMNSLLYDHATVAPRPLKLTPAPLQQHPAAAAPKTIGDVFGPSCDGLDTVLRGYALPELDVGDWLVFASHGAYTFTGACPFNGMDPTPSTFYVFSQQ